MTKVQVSIPYSFLGSVCCCFDCPFHKGLFQVLQFSSTKNNDYFKMSIFYSRFCWKLKFLFSLTMYGVLHRAVVCQPTESDQCYLDKWILYFSVIGQLCRPYWLLTVQPAKFESCNKYNIYLTKLVCWSVLCTYCKLRIPVLFVCLFFLLQFVLRS